MARNKYFEDKRSPIAKRRAEIRDPKPSAILIVTEGTKTEPLYFQGLVDYITDKFGKNIDVRSPNIDVRGKGLGTKSLVNEAASMASHANKQYSQCWVVFDKDYYEDFDDAINLAKKYGFEVAWSNSCFEYWLLLHFKRDVTARKPQEWQTKVETELKRSGLLKGDYTKNNECISKLPLLKGSLRKAVENARSREHDFPASCIPSKRDPGTTVHHLIESLSPYIEELF